MQLLKIETTAHGCVGMAHKWSHIYVIYSILQLKPSHQKSIKLKFAVNTLMLNHCTKKNQAIHCPFKIPLLTIGVTF
jgi:hypothetical protein